MNNVKQIVSVFYVSLGAYRQNTRIILQHINAKQDKIIMD